MCLPSQLQGRVQKAPNPAHTQINLVQYSRAFIKYSLFPGMVPTVPNPGGKPGPLEEIQYPLDQYSLTSVGGHAVPGLINGTICKTKEGTAT